MKKPTYQWLLSQQLTRELGSLRGGQGLTREAFDKVETVQYVLAVSDSTLTRHQLRERFIERLRELGTTPQIRALRNAYGVDLESNPGTLTKRREDFAAREEMELDTVKNWENTAIGEMVLELTGALSELGDDEDGKDDRAKVRRRWLLVGVPVVAMAIVASVIGAMLILHKPSGNTFTCFDQIPSEYERTIWLSIHPREGNSSVVLQWAVTPAAKKLRAQPA